MRHSIATLSRPAESTFAFNRAKCNFVIDLQRGDAISRCTERTSVMESRKNEPGAFPSSGRRQREIDRGRLTGAEAPWIFHDARRELPHTRATVTRRDDA